MSLTFQEPTTLDRKENTVARSLFRPSSISGAEIAAKRAAIASLYFAEFAASMPWYPVLAVYRSLDDRGKFVSSCVTA